MKRLNVQVGDYIYTRSRVGTALYLHKVDRLTKTQAVCGKSRFKLTDGQLVGSSGHRVSFGYEATDEIIEEFKMQRATARVEQWAKSKYKNPETIKAVYELIRNENGRA